MCNEQSLFIHKESFDTSVRKAYLKELPANKEVFVIRTKSLWPDWVTVNNLLGSPEDVPVPDSINEGKVVNSQGKLPVTSNLSDEGRESLCKFMRNEYILYFDLLNRAVNLSDDDIKSTLDDAYKNCPVTMESIVQNNSLANRDLHSEE